MHTSSSRCPPPRRWLSNVKKLDCVGLGVPRLKDDYGWAMYVMLIFLAGVN